MARLRTIAILGPESSGKSTLCAQLAAHLNGIWVHEYVREYMREYVHSDVHANVHDDVPAQTGVYTEADLLAIGRGQLRLNQAGIAQAQILAQTHGHADVLFDTEATVLAVWAQAALGYVPPEIEHACATQTFTDYLLLTPDLPWQADPLRSAPELAQRQAIFAQYEIWLARYQRPYTVVSGHGAARLHCALRALNG